MDDGWYSIRRVADLNDYTGIQFDWRKLRQKSKEMGISIKKVFDANCGEITLYHEKVWGAVYPDAEL